MTPIIEYILLSGIIISAFLGLLLIQKKNKSVSEMILLFWILTSGYVTYSYLLVFNGSYLTYPTATALGFSIPLLSGPFMYLYIKYQTQPLFFQKKDLFHFLPFVLSNLLFLKFYFLPFETKLSVLSNGGVEFETEGLIKLIAIYLSGVIYISWCFVSLYFFKKRFKKEFSNIDSINFNWLFMLNIGLLVIWIVVIFIQDDNIIFSAAAIYVMCIGFFGITQTNVFTERDVLYIEHQDKQNEVGDSLSNGMISGEKEPKYKDENLEEIYIKTTELLQKEKLYLNPELKILDLAILLNVHPNVMSKAINHVSEANFYDLVNNMRVDEFIRRTKSEDAGKYTILAIALDSGFNSKAAFYRNFKLITGESPTEFIKSRL